MKKKIFAVLLSLAMAISLLPMSALAAEEVPQNEEPVQVSTLAQLRDALEHAGTAGSGDSIISIISDLVLADGDKWTPIKVDGYNGAGVVTVKGNGHTISGLTDALFAGGFAGKSGIVIKNLTLEEVDINDSTEQQGLGAFIKCVDSMPTIELDSCHLKNSSITSTGGARVGGLIGWTAGYDVQNDGPVDTRVTVTNCSVESCNITAAGSVGGIIGHAGTNPATYQTITGCTVKDCNLNSEDDGGWRVGVVVGTANVGEVTITNTTESGNTLEQTGKTAPEHSNLYGRFVPNTTGKLVIDGKAVFADDVVAAIGDNGYTTLAAAIEAAADSQTVTLLKDIDLGTGSLTIDKGITLDGGEAKHSITSSIGGAVIVVSTDEQVAVQNLKIFATASGKTGRGIAINDTAAKLDVKNVEIETTQRGITVNPDANNGIVLKVEDSTLSLVEPGKTANDYDYNKTVLSTNDYNNSRGISLWEMANSTVTLKNTTVQGFYYSINSAGSNSSENMQVSANGCTFKGRAAVNQHAKSVQYTITNCDITGINNFGGESESFACIVMNESAIGNTVIVNGGTRASVSFDNVGAENSKATEFLVTDRAGNNTITLNDVTYTCPREYGDNKGGITESINPGTVITVNDGTYTMPELVGASHSVNGEVGQLNILGGDFTYNVVSTNESEPYVLNISGGTFSADPTAYLADNTIVKRNGSAEPYTYTVLAKANLTSGVYLSDPTGALANRYYVSNADTENCVWTVSYSAPSSSGGSSSSGSATTEKNPDGSTTTTVTKPDGSKTETTTSQPVTDESGTTTTTKTETVTNKDGSKTETTTETVKGADGATTETKTQVATDKTGATTSTETVKATDANGSTATKVTETNAAGETTTNVQTTVSDKAVAEAAKDEAPVTLPVEVTAPKAGDTKEAAPVVQVDLPASVTPENPAKVQIPVADITPGTVAVIVNADGTEEIVKDSVVDENGVILNLEGSATVKLVDNSKDFDDTKNHWAQDSIDFVTAREIFNGTSDTTFSPNSDMTRGMLMTVLARFDGQDTSGGTVWYEKGMEWAKANGISDGTNPNEPVTREQLATMLYRYAGSPAAEGSFDAFPDGGNVNDYADAAMRWAVETGLINGMGDGTLNPQGDAARAQLAAILMRFCENLVK